VDRQASAQGRRLAPRRPGGNPTAAVRKGRQRGHRDQDSNRQAPPAPRRRGPGRKAPPLPPSRYPRPPPPSSHGRTRANTGRGTSTSRAATAEACTGQAGRVPLVAVPQAPPPPLPAYAGTRQRAGAKSRSSQAKDIKALRAHSLTGEPASSPCSTFRGFFRYRERHAGPGIYYPGGVYFSSLPCGPLSCR
jgi:hypothetical protein